MPRERVLGKEEILYDMFPEVGSTISIDDAMIITGINSNGSIRTILWKFRKGRFGYKSIRVSLKSGVLTRVE